MSYRDTAKRIEDSLVQISGLSAGQEGYSSIEQVKFDWINIADHHTRRAIVGDLFLFPRLDLAIEDLSWDTGIALRKGSPKVYRWNLQKPPSNKPQ